MRLPILLRTAALLAATLIAACTDRLPSGANPGGPRLTVTPTNAFTTIDAGSTHACGLTSGGQGWCWGRNAAGQLGDSTAASTLVPVAVYHPAGVTFAQISAGGQHTCALDASGGAAWCWGYNADGRLGDGTTNLPLMPVAVQGGLSFTSISAGGQHTCALDSGGQAYCWGYNFYGQIGNNSSAFASSPTAVQQPSGVTFAAIQAGDKHTCALDGAGQAYCWGYGGDGAVGNNSVLGSRVPVAVQQPSGVTFASIATEYNHACGVDSGGQAYCWGLNGNGQLGDSTVVNRTVPVAVLQSGLTFASVTTGLNLTCARNSSGQAYCWGSNQYGQLGNGTTTSSRIPVAVSQPSGVTFPLVTAGSSQACGLDTGGQTWCWGRNNFGQLGDNSSTNRNAPVATQH